MIDTHGYTMRFGRHRGELITRVPVSYLRWMVRESHQEAAHAQAELDRRGTSVPEIEVSNHAIDRASLRCRKIWHATRRDEEGIASWLARVAAEAYARGGAPGEKIEHEGMLFVFAEDGAWPLLKSVVRKKGGEHAASEGEEVSHDDGG